MKVQSRVRWLVMMLACAALVSCGQAATAQPTIPQLRITNDSEFGFDRVVVMFPREQITFEAVAPGATTVYQPVLNGVYSYAAYEITFDGRTINQDVLDWSGEKPMAGVAFTYVLSVDPQRPEWQIVQHEVLLD